MTLVVTVNGPETIWLLADRRLTSRGRVLRDDARKVMFLETPDGVAILATNSRDRFDPAFVRRLDSILEFPLPDGAARRRLWR